MKNFYLLFVLTIVFWLAKLSYDNYGLSTDLENLQNNIRAIEQKNATLNDQMVAVQRQSILEKNKDAATQNSLINQNSPSSQINLHSSILIQPQLEFIQFAIQQRQFMVALEKLNSLDQTLNQYDLAETVKNALHEALEQDKKNLQQFMITENNQIQQLQAVLTNIDQILKFEQKNQNIQISRADKSSFWGKWIKIDQVDHQTPEIVYRRMILKEAQLRVLLAKQNLEKGQILDYQNMLSHVVLELDQLPDQNAKNIVKAVQNLKQSKMLPETKLVSLAVLE